MTVRAGRRRTGERGLMRQGCCLVSLVLTVAPLLLAAYVAFQATARPDLGAAPRGPLDGTTEPEIAAAMARRLLPALVRGPHALITVSEQDLTVLAGLHNPAPAVFHNPVARVRDGRVVVSGGDTVLSRSVTLVAHVDLGVVDDAAGGHVQAALEEIDVGRLTVPGWAASRLVPRGASPVNLSALLGSNAVLRAASAAVECVLAGGEGVIIGIHRPGLPADPAACGV